MQRIANEPGLELRQFVHDLDNLLMVIASRAEIAQADIDSNRDCTKSIRAIQAAARQAQNLSELLRCTQARQAVPKQNVDLVDAVRSAVEGVRSWMPSRVSIVLDIPTDESIQLFGNDTQLQRVIQNVLSNAFDALRSGGRVFVTLELTNKRPAQPSFRRNGKRQTLPKRAILRIRDTGIGMDEHAIGRVIEPGFSMKHGGAGRGLGLSIVSDIVRDHGGSIKIHSFPARGTEIVMDFPVAQSAESEANDG